MIDGVIITPLKRLTDDRGAVMHMLRRDSPVFQAFGEIYFSSVHPGAIKAWRLHRAMTINYAVPRGRIRFVLHDEREASPTRGATQEILIGDDNYVLVTAPPLIWNGFRGLGDETALVANCATMPHDPAEVERRDPFDPAIGYDWTAANG